MHRIFISAVSTELKSYRTLVGQSLQKRNYQPVFQDIFDLTDEEIIELLTREVSSCDAVICLIGYRYGAEPSTPPHPFARCSFTQFEYLLASHFPDKKKIPIYRFLTNADTPVDHPQDEDQSLRLMQEKFRSDVTQDRNWRSFSNHTELRAEIAELKFPWEESIHRIQPNNLPAVGSLFEGREDFIERLRHLLAQNVSQKAAITAKQKIHGLGGVGKTRVAIEFAKRFSKDYSALLFVTADTPSTFEANLASLCGAMVLNLPEKDAANQDEQVAAAIGWLRRNSGWLLIIDNVDSKETAQQVETLLSKLDTGHVLITSRLSDWGASIEPLGLDVVTEEAAKRILLMRTEGKRKTLDSDHDDALALGQDLGQLPLALEQAGAFIAKNASSFKDYRQRWKSHEAKVIQWHDPLQMKYPRSVATTWETTFDLLSQSGRGVLNLISWLAPDPIPREMIYRLDNEEGEAPIDPEEGIADLVDYSFLKRSDDQNFVSIHRLVQEISQLRIEESSRLHWLTRSLRMVDAFCDGDPTDPSDWDRIYGVMWPHAKKITQIAYRNAIQHPTSELLLEFARYLFVRSEFLESESCSRLALEIIEQEFGPQHPKVTAYLNDLAIILKEMNRLADAEALLHRSISIIEGNYGPDHPALVSSLSNLAQLIQDSNRLEEAEHLMHRALAIYDRIDEKDRAIQATLLGNLAQLFHQLNRFEEAESMMRKALVLIEECHGSEHPKVAGWISNLATLLQTRHRFAEAEPLNRRSLELSEKAFGPEHPNVATALGNLAELLKSTNRLVESEVHLRRALKIDEKAYGPDHPMVATRMMNLAQLLNMTNRLEEGHSLARRALQIDEESLGLEHPTVATDLSTLASLLEDMDRIPEAESLIRRGLAITEKSFGNDHPEVALQLNSLAQLFQATKRLNEAEPLLRRALEIYEKFYGSEHTTVIKIRSNLARLLSSTDRLEEAESLMRQVLRWGEERLGPDDPILGTFLNNLAQLLESTDRLDEAASLSRRAFRAFELFRLRNGHGHPYAHLSQGNFRNILRSLGRTDKQIEEEMESIRVEVKKGDGRGDENQSKVPLR